MRVRSFPIRLSRTLFVGSTILAVAPTVSCGGSVGNAVRPEEFTGADALGGVDVTCAASKGAEPLLVDLPGEMRGELEAQFRQGVAVVSYDCKSLRVLTECKVESGSYRFSGWTMKSNVVQMKGRDELKANLPLSAVKLSGAVESGRSIELALLNIGSQSTTLTYAQRDRLVGDCAGATHFVKKAYLGAFSLATTSSGKASLAADLFGKVGTEGKSELERNAASTDGSLDACKGADPTADKPPAECNVPVRAILIPVTGTAPAPKKKAATEDGEKAKLDGPALEGDRDPCPTGFKLSDGACRKVAATHLCAPEDQAECAAECNKGDVGSCFNLGVIKYVAQDNAGAKAAFGKACAAGHVDACGGAARASYPETATRSTLAATKAALELSKKACLDGSPIGCWDAYSYLHDTAVASFESMIDYGQAMKFAVRACQLGEADGCVEAGTDLIEPPPGAPFTKDAVAGLAFLQSGCDAGAPHSCKVMAEYLFKGSSGVKADAERAMKLDRFACDLDPAYCADNLDAWLKAGKAQEAFSQAKRACSLATQLDKVDKCKRLAEFYTNGTGTAKDKGAAKEAMERSKQGEAELCEAGNSAWCAD